MYKLIALDLDGTLLNSKRLISEKNKQAILKSKAAGINIVLASGRIYKSVLKYIKELGIEGLHITMQGSVIYDFKSGEFLNEINIDRASYNTIIDELKRINLPFCVYTKNLVYTENAASELEPILSTEIFDIKFVNDLYTVENPVKILTIASDRKWDGILKAGNFKDVKVMRTGNDYIEIISSKTGKEKGLQYIAESLGIKQSEIIAFGDNENDIGMIKYAGMGVAMGNAEEDIKSISNIIAPDHDLDGVAQIIESVVLNTGMQ